ncbi:MAG: sensor histidine kinase [Acidobacteriota bacterium]
MHWTYCRGFPTCTLVASVSLFVLAGVFLHRGINRVIEADRLQQRAFLDAAVQSLKGEFSRTIFEVVSALRPSLLVKPHTDLEGHVCETLVQWQRTSDRARVIKSISLGTIKEDGTTSFRSLAYERTQFEDAEWPAELAAYRDAIHLGRQRGGAFGFRPIIPCVNANPVLVFPLVLAGHPPIPAAGPRADGSESSQIPLRFVAWCFLELDSHFLRTELLPSLIERQLRRPGLSQYRVAVVAGDPPRVLFSTAPGVELSSLEPPDARMNLFSVQPPFPLSRRPALASPRQLDPGNTGRDCSDWVLIVQHEAGSLDAAMQSVARRNQAIGFGMLILLAGSTVLSAVSAQRARAVAQQRMEFVAGVTHEFRTPLTVLRSAGFNLTQRLADDSRQVRRYGELIQAESRKLSIMVEQVLSCAQIQSGRGRYDLKPLDVSKVVAQVLSDYKLTFESGRWEVQEEIEEAPALVRGDEQAIQNAVKNLLDNALRYAAGGRWLLVGVRGIQDEVQVIVQDRGPGVDPGDIPHLFEPFYRGKGVVTSGISGAGLGLSLVHEYLRVHGGRVTVDRPTGGGARFTLHFPALDSREAIIQERIDVEKSAAH